MSGSLGSTQDALPPATVRVRDAAERLGLAITLRLTDGSARTAEEAATACGCDVAQIVKSLVFAGRDSGKPVLLLVSGKNRVDEAGSAALIGEALTRPNAAAVREWTGFAIGGIPPLGLATAMPVFIDEDLLRFDSVWAAAGTPKSVFAVSPQALAAAIGAAPVRVG